MRIISKTVNYMFLLAGILCILYYLAMGFAIRFGQSMLWLWPLAGGVFIARFFLFKNGTPTMSKWLLHGARVIFALGLSVFLIVEGIIFSSFMQPLVSGLDYVVILGAKVNGTQPSGALKNRIEVAAEYLQQNPNTIAVASGGQGEDEGISEAQCIYNGLTERGIEPGRILLEEKSTSTYENLLYSSALINDEKATIGLITNNFHMHRALMGADRVGVKQVYGIPVATSWISMPHYMVREFCAVSVEWLKDII